ncbi:MAG TPA: hypothetical protein VE396_06460 [Xanthobacteraceae bacterium]|nr:hypothetical protein [Xanthobacteraceae bacterium]
MIDGLLANSFAASGIAQSRLSYFVGFVDFSPGDDDINVRSGGAGFTAKLEDCRFHRKN